MKSFLLGPLLLSFSLTLAVSGASRFELLDGDRVVLVGDTFIEREQAYGYLEQRLTVEFPQRNIIFRNLGWSGDTPAGVSRASFDFNKPGQAFEKLKKHLQAVQPTVMIIGYGMASSFDGRRGVAPFKGELTQLIEATRAVCTNGPVRFVLLSPIRHEQLPAPLPDPSAHNQQLMLYVNAVQQVATEQQCEFVSLYELTGAKGRPLTENGIHLSDYGYWRVAEEVARKLGWSGPAGWEVRVDSREGAAGDAKVQGTALSELRRNRQGVRFVLTDDRLINPVLKGADGKSLAETIVPCRIQIKGLERGNYELRIDGVPQLQATAGEWSKGVKLDGLPQFDQAEALSEVIRKKNEHYFNRWRPQNETYLFGFRKYEQGQNAKEIPMFDPLVAEQEQKIAGLRQPQKRLFELKPTTRPPVVIKYATNLPAAGPGQAPAPGGAAAEIKSSPAMFDVASGFEVNLFAESPLLAKPIQMNFDPEGRLWIASSAVYPQIEPGKVADDKILVLEDKNGDGFAETSTVFAEGLLIPTGIEPGDQGAYVGQSTELLHLRDTDGDGKADQKRVVLSGFGTEDTHHIVHTLRWGHDGQLYFNQSIYIHSHLETPHGVGRLNSGGLWHLRPASLELGIFLRGFCNPWGHDFDGFGQSFVTDGAGNQGINFGVQGATYFTYADMRRELKSVSPGNYPKFCGLEIVRSAHFPEDWQGNAVTCDFRAHRVVRFGIEEQGSAYATKELPDLMRTTNVTFRPIDVKLGPDGALYIADWSNPIIQHGEVDFRDPRRDHEHGRIWRVTVKERELVKPFAFRSASNDELLAKLLSTNAYDQRQARRVLIERGAAIRRDLARWTKAQTTEAGWMEALWMHQAIDRVEPELLQKVLQAKDGRVRAAAVRVVGFWQARLKQPLELLAKAIVDEEPRVRLEAMRALARIPSVESASLVLNALERPMDPFLDYALWLSINDLAIPWNEAVRAGRWKIEGREKQLEFALKALQADAAGPVLNHVLAGREFPKDGSGPWLELAGEAGDAKLLSRLFEQVTSGGFDSAARARALEALTAAARKRQAKPESELDRVTALFGETEQATALAAMRLAGAWKLPGAVSPLSELAGGENVAAAQRAAAFEALREIGGKTVVDRLRPLTAKGRPMELRRQAVLASAALDLDKTSGAAVDLLSEQSNEAEAMAVWRSLLGIKGAGPKLAQALPKSGLSPALAKAGLRVAREGGRNEPDLVWALTRGADLEGESEAMSTAELQQLASRAGSEGNAIRGEKVFRRKELNCVTCHAVGGVGGKVGPDLTSIGASAPVDYLLESLLYPNRKIKEGYHSVIVATKDGLEYSGVLVRENSDELVLRDATDKETVLSKSNLENRATGNSLMPSGLVDGLSAGDRLDLVRFLSELGKPGAYDASKGNVARAWKLLVQTLDLAQFGDQKALTTATTDSQWSWARTLVDGQLLKEELNAALDSHRSRAPQAVYAAARFEVAKAGPIALQVSGADGAPAWIDGKPAGACGELKADLAAGPHTVIVKLDAKKVPESIRIECADATFLNKF